MARDNARLEIGGVARAHGIKGEVVIVTHDPDSDSLSALTSIFIDGIERPITNARNTHRGWLIALEGITTRNDAELLQGKPVEVDRSALDLDDDDILLNDLVGCRVVLPDGTPWGKVTAVDMGMQDLLVIHDGDIERLLPLVDELVTSIDLTTNTITVDPPEGLPNSKVMR